MSARADKNDPFERDTYVIRRSSIFGDDLQHVC